MRWLVLTIFWFLIMMLWISISWIMKETNIIKTNKKILLSGLQNMKSLKHLDNQVLKILKKSKIKILDRAYAREKLVNFSNKYKKNLDLEIVNYIKEDNGIFFLVLTAKLTHITQINQIFALLKKGLLMKINSIRKQPHGLTIKFEVSYPFKEHL